jgi:single-stranded-DNA-specific exonuclease
VGEKHLKLVLEGPDRLTVDAIAFNIDVATWPDPTVQRIHALYALQLNHFRGRTSVQLQLEHFVALR